MTDAPEPCPFCGADMETPYLRNPDVYKHPEGTACFAGRAIVHPENLAAWNTRADLSAAAVEQARAEGYAQALKDAAEVIHKKLKRKQANFTKEAQRLSDWRAPSVNYRIKREGLDAMQSCRDTIRALSPDPDPAEMIQSLAVSSIGQMWNEEDPRKTQSN